MNTFHSYNTLYSFDKEERTSKIKKKNKNKIP